VGGAFVRLVGALVGLGNASTNGVVGKGGAVGAAPGVGVHADESVFGVVVEVLATGRQEREESASFLRSSWARRNP